MGREVGISVGISEALDYILYIPNYRVSVIISRGLYTFYPILEDHFVSLGHMVLKVR